MSTFDVNQLVTVDWQNLGGAAASSNPSVSATSYTALRNAYLALTGLNSLQAQAYTPTNIPASDPFLAANPSAAVWCTAALALSLNLFNTSGCTVTFSSVAGWDTNLHGTSCGNAFSMYATAWHEMTECLGRFMSSGIWVSNVYLPGDLWTWDVTGTSRNFTNSGTRLLQPTSGATAIFNMSQNNGDQGDVVNSGSGSAFNTTDQVFLTDPIGTVPPPAGNNIAGVSFAAQIAADLQYMTLMGWRLLNLNQAGLGTGGNSGVSLMQFRR
jgi:hypothetical protein